MNEPLSVRVPEFSVVTPVSALTPPSVTLPESLKRSGPDVAAMPPVTLSLRAGEGHGHTRADIERRGDIQRAGVINIAGVCGIEGEGTGPALDGQIAPGRNKEMIVGSPHTRRHVRPRRAEADGSRPSTITDDDRLRVESSSVP